MAQARDGYFDLEFNSDRTQVYATVYPPQGGGRSVTAQEVRARLRQMGVMYGYRDSEILRAIKQAEETQTPAARIVVAQGLLPEDGDDGQVLWKVDVEALSLPLPSLSNGLPDYFALEPERRVQAGQLLASRTLPHPGAPGKSLTGPLRSVPQHGGRDVSLLIGGGVRASEDGQCYFAAVDGFAVYQGGRLSVLPLQRVEDDLPPGEHRFPGGLVLLGGLRGASVRAQDVVAVRGTTAGAVIRTHGDVVLTRAARSKVFTEGNVYVLGTLLHCEVNTSRKIIALESATLVGGTLTATEGVEAVDLGAPDATETRVTVGVDRLSACRLTELEEEIAACELNVQKIGQALRPLTIAASEALPAQKRQLVQTLLEQRRGLEARVRELHSERRLRMMSAKARITGTVTVTGTVHPGVWITIRTAETLVESPQQGVVFAESDRGRRVAMTPLTSIQAA